MVLEEKGECEPYKSDGSLRAMFSRKDPDAGRKTILVGAGTMAGLLSTAFLACTLLTKAGVIPLTENGVKLEGETIKVVQKYCQDNHRTPEQAVKDFTQMTSATGEYLQRLADKNKFDAIENAFKQGNSTKPVQQQSPLSEFDNIR